MSISLEKEEPKGPEQQSMERPDEIVINTCFIGGHLMGGAEAIRKGYEAKYNLEEQKPVAIRVEHAPPYMWYFNVTKKTGEKEETKGGCCGSAFWKMFMIVTCCCDEKRSRDFADEF